MDEQVRELVVRAAQALSFKKATDVVVFEVAEVLAITDAFVIGSGTSSRHVRTLAEEVEASVRSAGGMSPKRIEGLQQAAWVLLDFGDFVVHIFDEQSRQYYELERLWADSVRVDWEQSPRAVSMTPAVSIAPGL